MSSSDWRVNVGSRVSLTASAKPLVSPLRSSNCRTGHNPASLDNAAGEISIFIGRDGRKSNDNSRTECKLISGLRACVDVVFEHQLIRTTRPFRFTNSE